MSFEPDGSLITYPAAGAETVINEDGVDADFRVEGDTEPNLFFVDAENNRIGIGTSAPKTAIHIETPETVLQVIGTSSSAQVRMVAYRESVSTHTNFVGWSARGTAASPAALQDGDEIFRLSAAGYDGSSFATDSRAQIQFAVDGAVSTGVVPQRVTFALPDSAGSMRNRMRIASDGGIITYPDAGGTFVINENGVDADFRVEGDTEPNLLFVDAGNDRVGLFTSSPNYSLDIYANTIRLLSDGTSAALMLESYRDSSATHNDIRARAARGTVASPSALLNGDDIFYITAQGYNGDVITAVGAKLIIDAAGNWSATSNPGRITVQTTPINSTSPVTRLRIDHDGGIFMYNLLSAAASTDVNINANNELHKVTSSKRFKKAIKPLEARFDSSLIYELEPVSFVWRKNTGNPDMVDFGIIAEDAYEIMPELVNLDEEGKPFSVRYSMLPVMLLAEVQKLTKRVEALEHAN